MEDTYQQIIDDHPLKVDAIGGTENLLLKIFRDPGDVGLIS